jgi:hypothetical protein
MAQINADEDEAQGAPSQILTTSIVFSLSAVICEICGQFTFFQLKACSSCEDH